MEAPPVVVDVLQFMVVIGLVTKMAYFDMYGFAGCARASRSLWRKLTGRDGDLEFRLRLLIKRSSALPLLPRPDARPPPSPPFIPAPPSYRHLPRLRPPVSLPSPFRAGDLVRCGGEDNVAQIVRRGPNPAGAASSAADATPAAAAARSWVVLRRGAEPQAR